MVGTAKALKRLIPPRFRRMIRTYRENRERARLFGDLAPLVPKVEDMFEGPQDLQVFKDNGEEFLAIYKDICDLRTDEKMLDVGSGIGRKTIPLTQYFNERARYEGIDVTKAGINWCREKITPKFPNFRFQWIDAYNKHYNPEGKCPSTTYKFPFADQSFSFVMLGSVFTHMRPVEVENYLSEVTRVMVSGERCLITYFLLNEESLSQIERGHSTLSFIHAFNNYRTVSREVPEFALALDENWIRGLYKRVGLQIKRVDYGSWYGRQPAVSYQDLILAVKV